MTAVVADTGLDVPVHGCLCFVDTELPLFGTPAIKGLKIFGRRGLARQLNASGRLSDRRRGPPSPPVSPSGSPIA